MPDPAPARPMCHPGDWSTLPIFTTGPVARICRVSPSTVSKWCDDFDLGGYRLPGSRDRRIPRDELAKFLLKHGMTSALASIGGEAAAPSPSAVLLLVAPSAGLAGSLGSSGLVRVEVAASAIEAAGVAAGLRPTAVVVGSAVGRIDAAMLAFALGRLDPSPGMVAVVPDEGSPVPAGYGEVVAETEGIEGVVGALVRLAGRGSGGGA